MNHLAKLLNPHENILLDLDVASMKRLLEEAAKVLSSVAGVPAQNLFDALFAREKLGATGLGGGVAIPHARVQGAIEPCLCFIRTHESIPCEGPKQKEARIFFIVAIPENTPETYLDILADVAGLLSTPNAIDALLNAADAAEVATQIQAWEPKTK